MKKTLVALAALASISAFAQSSVTVYGVLDAGYSDNTKTIDTNKYGQKAISFNNFTSSRIGFKGTEDIGGGTKANFVIESGLSSNTTLGTNAFLPGTTNVPTNVTSTATANANTTADQKATAGTSLDATTLGNRELNASLQFASGTVIGAGYGSTGIRDTVLAYDAAGGINVVGNILVNDAQFSSNRATALAIRQPLAAGLVGSFGLSSTVTTKTGGVDNKAATGYMGSLKYDNGPLSTAVSYQKSDTVTSATADKTVKTLVAGASYALPSAKLFTEYGSVTTDNNTTTAIAGQGKRSGYSVGVQVPVGAATPFVQYSSGNKNENYSATANTAEKRNYKGYSVGVTYALSKRTFAYGVIGQTKLDAAATAANGVLVKNTETTFGLAHSF